MRSGIYDYGPKGGQGEQLDFTEEDEFGKILEVTKSSDSGSFGFIVRKGNWEENRSLL